MGGRRGEEGPGAITDRLRLSAGSLVLLFSAVLAAQSPATTNTVDIVVQAVDGRNGKPLASQRLLVFTGMSSNAVRSQAKSTELTTNKDGVGTLTIDPAETQWIQVWPDGPVLCQPHPNEGSFSVDTIISKGLATPNDCSGLAREPVPGHFIVFARPATFVEKMRR
jgi:hypothetical protein